MGGRLIGAAVQGLAMGTFLLVGWLWPRDGQQRLINRAGLLNVVNGAVMFGVRVTLVVRLAEVCQWRVWDPEWLSMPLAQFLVAFLALDFSRYWLHRAAHRVSWLWTFHRVHHSAETLDSTTGLRMHVVDFLQLSMLPVLLFGILLDTSDWASWVLPVTLGVGVCFDAFQHGNIRWNSQHPLARGWNLLLNHPHFHVWHHTRDAQLCDGNYGNTLVIWDRLFGSEVTKPEPPEALGLDSSQALQESIVGWQLLRRRVSTSS